MAIRNIKRWQWILASLLIGYGLGYFQQLPSEDWQKKFGGTITQAQFEEGLTREQSGLRWFRDIVIYPESIEIAGKSVPVTIVSGNYFGGKLELQDGKPAAVWRPRCYIVEGTYQPIAPKGEIKPADTVQAYLTSLKDVHFTYAWWRDPSRGIALWMAGSFVVIGLIWPTVINLIVFGSVWRPKEEKGTDLSKAPVQSSHGGSKVTDADLAAVAQMGDELEEKLAAGASAKAPQAHAPVESTPVRALTAAALEAAAAEAREKKGFGRDKDDFYPTEVHKPH